MRPQNPFRTLRHRNFRLLWSGEVLRTSAQWMDLLTRGLLVLDLTGSASQVALVTALRSLPLFFVGVWGGLLADRMDRRRLLLASRSLTVVAFVLLAVLVFLGWTPMWIVDITAIVVGLGQALNGPARQSLLPSLVPEEELSSAVVLNTATLNIGQALGPVIAGFSVGLVGIGGTFLVQAAFVVVGGWLIARMDLVDGSPKSKDPMLRSAAEAIRYLMGRPLLLGLFAVVFTLTIFVDSFRGVVPVIAVDVLGADPVRSGALIGALGVGAIVAVVLLAVFPTSLMSWRIIVAGAIGFGLAVLGFALSSTFWLSIVLLFAAGFCQACFRTQAQTLQLRETEDRFRGRVTSLWVVLRGTEPVGSLLLAALTTVVGVGMAVGAMAAVGVAVAAIVAFVLGRRWRAQESGI